MRYRDLEHPEFYDESLIVKLGERLAASIHRNVDMAFTSIVAAGLVLALILE